MKKNLLSLISMLILMSGSLFAQNGSGWVAPDNMLNNMTVTGKLQTGMNGTDTTYSGNTADDIGAFVGNNIRGVNHPGADKLFFLTISSNETSGENVRFKAFLDDGTGNGTGSYKDIYFYKSVDSAKINKPAGGHRTMAFVNNTFPGTDTKPYIFVTTDIKYTISPSVGTAGGTIAPLINEDVAEGASSTVYTITPLAGHHIVSVIRDNGVDVINDDVYTGNGSDAFTYQFTNVTSNWTIKANFAINKYTLSFTAGPNGTLSGPNPANITGPGLTGKTQLIYTNIDHGTALGSITAVPNSVDYAFVSWGDGRIVNPWEFPSGVVDNVTATASFALAGWTPGTNYNNTMTVIGKIFIGGIASSDPNDMLGAYINNLCCGVASPDPDNDGNVFLSIGSNTTSGDPIVLKIFDSSTGTVCIADFPYTFANNTQIGTLSSPHPIACQRELTIAIPSGYTWFSANIKKGSEDEDWHPNTYFAGAWFNDATHLNLGFPAENDRIIGQTAFAVYTTKWIGSLTAMNPAKMYRYYNSKVATPLYLHLVGSAVDNDPITINAGYTWLGYLPREEMPINTALAGLTGMGLDDRLIGQGVFSVFNGTSWVGSITKMKPGVGYVIKMANAGTLTYPDGFAKSVAVTPENVVSPAGFEAPANMKNTMMLIGQLDKASFGEKDVVYAFINGECRGMAATSADGNIYLSIGENSEEAQEVSFKVWVDAKGELANIDQKVIFEPLKAVGDLNNPFTFKMSETGTTDSWMVGKAYPNPFNEQTIIPLWLKESAQVTVNVYNNMGQLVKTVAQSAAKSGVSNIILQKENLDKGVYYYTVNINSSSANVLETGKLIIQ